VLEIILLQRTTLLIMELNMNSVFFFFRVVISSFSALSPDEIESAE
jgi:hypothetical protein